MLAQTIPPWEIIVVDDGSTDGGGEMVKAMNIPGLRLIRQENQGVSAARNRGVAEAKSELIAFLDADDAWKPRFLEVINYLHKKYSDAGAYATAYELVNPLGEKPTLKFNALPNGLKDGLIADYLKTGITLGMAPPILSSSVAIPQSVFQVVGGFPVGEYLSEDMDTWLRIALRYPIAWSREPLAIWYQNAQNRAYGCKRWNAEPAISQTARRALRSNLISEEQKQDLREYAATFQIYAARDCLLQGHRDVALQILSYAKGTRLSARYWWRWRLMAALPGKSASYFWKMKQFLHRQAN